MKMEDLSEKEKKCCRYLANEMSKEDRLIFEIELTIDHELQLIFENYRKIWICYPYQIKGLKPATDTHMDLKKKQKRTKRSSLKRDYLLLTLLIIAVITGLFTLSYKDSVPNINIVNTDRTEPKQYFLPDSSTVTLNTDSNIRFKEDFSEQREVWLDGEAFFEIKKDIENPFIVYTNNFKVYVKGTSFNVNTTTLKQTVSLETGKVRVRLNKTDNEIDLHPNEQLIWDPETSELTLKSFKPEEVLGWKEDILILDNIRFYEALAKINAFYEVEFNIRDESVKSQHITGVFKNKKLEEFLAAMEFITDVEIIQESPQQFTIKSSNEN